MPRATLRPDDHRHADSGGRSSSSASSGRRRALSCRPRIPILGHLPGDIVIQRENVTIFIPLGTMLLVSVVVSAVIAFLNRR
jgi:hypothetical protein